MALDQALMRHAASQDATFLRLYRWEPHCLSFGRHEPALRRYDRAAIERMALDTVRRPTGGRAVWHARELTYAVAAPDGAFGSLREAYRRIHEALARALSALGASPTLAIPTRTASLESGACFASPAGGEVMVGGSKVVGSAQLRTGGGMLQHGSILLEDGQDMLARIAGGQVGEGGPGSAPLSALLARRVTWEETADAIVGHAAPALGSDWQVLDASPDLDLSGDLRQFSDPAWTWRR